MKATGLCLTLFSLAMLAGCSSAKKIQAMKPEPGNTAETAYRTETSFLNLPVTIALSDAEKQLNNYFPGLIYEDKNIDDDNIAMKVWKTAPIRFSEKNGRLVSMVPVRVTAQVKYGTSALGVSLYDTREINLNAVITFNSRVSLTNWKLSTTTSIESLQWKEAPTVTIAGSKVDITYLINPAVKLFKATIEDELDKALAAVTDFKPQVLDALQQLSAPFMTSQQYETWFKLTPVELYVTDAILAKNEITMQMGLKCTMQTIVGEKPENNFKKENVILKAVGKMPDKMNLSVAAVSTYESASKVITKNFKGQEFGEGKRKVTVQNVNLWSKDSKMIIALDLTGSINGTVYLSGYPAYNAATKEIYFDKLDYVLDTKSVLMKTANWLAEGYILRKIQDNCRYSIKDNLEQARASLLPYLNNYSPVAGVFINGSLDDFEFDKIELTGNAVIAFIKGSGTMALKVNGLK